MTPARRNHLTSTRAKREALAVLADYFCLNTHLAAELLGVSGRAVQAHYQRLIDAQLVYGIRYAPEEHAKGSIPIAYGLSDSGVTKAFADGFATDSTKTIKEHRPSRLEHEIMISRFHLELAKLCESKGWDLRWRQRDLQRGVYPDALLSINGRFFFLEIERAKLGNYKNGEPQILRKLKTYRDHYGSTDCEKNFGFRKFSVITVMRTRERRDNLVTFLKRAGIESGIFLNASEDSIFDFTTPKAGYTPSFDSLLTK
jgi:hypothetical protein